MNRYAKYQTRGDMYGRFIQLGETNRSWVSVLNTPQMDFCDKLHSCAVYTKSCGFTTCTPDVFKIFGMRFFG